MGYIQLIIILLFVGIALINALTKLHRKATSAKESSKISKKSVEQEVYYPSVDDEEPPILTSIEAGGTSGSIAGSNEEMLAGNSVRKMTQHEVEAYYTEMKQSQGKKGNEYPDFEGFETNFGIKESKMFSVEEKQDYRKNNPIINRIKKLPFFKQAVVMSEIMGKPKGI